MKKNCARFKGVSSIIFFVIFLIYILFGVLDEVNNFEVFSEIFDQTRLHLTVLLCPLLLIFLFKKKWILAFLVGSALLINSLTIVSAYNGVERGGGGKDDGGGFRVLSLNVNIENDDVEGVSDLIARSRADFVLILEASPQLGAELHGSLAKLYPYQTYKNTSELNRGFVGLSKYKLREEPNYISMGNSRQKVLFSTVSFRGDDIAVYGVHLLSPVGRDTSARERIAVREHQLVLLARHIEASSRTTPFVIAGDMNSVPWQKNMLEMKRLLNVNNSHSIGDMNGTWPAWLPRFIGFPIDHIYYSKALCHSGGGVLEIPGSDHRGVYADMKVCG